MVWIESITISRGTAPSDSVETMSSTEVSAASCTGASASPSRSARNRTCARPPRRKYRPRGAQRGHQAGGLRQKRRFADAGIAANQQYRAAYKAAAGDAVELDHAGRQARGVLALAGQQFQCQRPALAFAADRHRHRGRASGVLLGERVPLAAGFALALPAVIGRAAVLADEGERGFGHERVGSLLFLFCSIAHMRLVRDRKFAQHPALRTSSCGLPTFGRPKLVDELSACETHRLC